ncbi:STAS domain-containing protein [Pseudactinotalea suaedae]|uniref:STAS domain-containing protein n=1 Tax=Pseudactinotalea suaedae TaxID=1524924 RepID=UPI0012E151FD|nr:STAS domain-containing protein [Pseudactinotalea suaedae]
MDLRHERARADRATGTVSVLAPGAQAELVLTGEIDISMNSELVAALAELEQLGLPIEVHTRDVTSIDSSVIAFLASLALRCEQPITLVDPPALVRYLVQVAELGDVVEVVTRREEPARSSEKLAGDAVLRSREDCTCAVCRATPALV